MLKQILIKSCWLIIVLEMIIAFCSWGLFKQAPFIWLISSLAISTVSCISILIPFEIEKSINKSIQKEIGKYYIIRRLNGFSSPLSMNGEMLVMSDDNKFYRVNIERATISNISFLDNNIANTLV